MIAPLGRSLLGILLFSVVMGLADDTGKPEPQAVREFRGETLAEISGPVPDQVILNAQDYESCWKRLGLEQAPGLVDFSREVVVLATTRGSRIGFRLQVEGEGKLRVLAISTRDIRPGLRYLFGVFDRKDWQEINGTPLP